MWPILILLALTLLGALVSASYEARQYAEQITLNHNLLTGCRIAVGIILILMVHPAFNPLWYLKAIVAMAGLFGPTHRILLNAIRILKYPRVNRGLRIWTLRPRGYNTIAMMVFRNSPRIAFAVLCLSELAICFWMISSLA